MVIGINSCLRLFRASINDYIKHKEANWDCKIYYDG